MIRNCFSFLLSNFQWNFHSFLIFILFFVSNFLDDSLSLFFKLFFQNFKIFRNLKSKLQAFLNKKKILFDSFFFHAVHLFSFFVISQSRVFTKQQTKVNWIRWRKKIPTNIKKSLKFFLRNSNLSNFNRLICMKKLWNFTHATSFYVHRSILDT